MLEPYTSGSIGAAKNGNSGLAGLEIYLGASKGRRSRHRTLYTIPSLKVRTYRITESIWYIKDKFVTHYKGLLEYVTREYEPLTVVKLNILHSYQLPLY